MKTLQHYLHDIERFGYSPAKLYSRLFGCREGLPKILTVTVPKSGTNLLQRILTLHPMLYRRKLPTLGRRNSELWTDWGRVFLKTKPGEIVSSHFDYDSRMANYLLKDAKYKIIFAARDPRDIVISDMYYILKRPDHGYHAKLTSLKDEKEMLLALIRGDDGMRPINRQIQRFEEWINHEVLYVKYEDMVGVGGGGDDGKQKSVIKQIYAYLDMPLGEDLLNYISMNCRSSKSQTFRSGTINSWKIHFDDDLKDIFKESSGDLLIKMDYECGYDW